MAGIMISVGLDLEKIWGLAPGDAGVILGVAEGARTGRERGVYLPPVGHRMMRHTPATMTEKEMMARM